MITLTLSGGPYERGRQHADADPALRAAALNWMTLRHGRLTKLLADAELLAYAKALHAHALTAAPDLMEELRGIAEGFGMAPFDLFCGWYAPVLGDAKTAREGCTAVAVGRRGRTNVAKNRDVPGEQQRIQTVFRMHDPAWRGGDILSVCSLGSTPAASSGINAAGLCVTDTAISTKDLGVGLSRYLVMQKLLQECRDAAEAVTLLRRLKHAGGGSLVIADARGAVAAIELGHRVSHYEEARGGTVTRTNHFIGKSTERANLVAADSPAGINSRARLATVHRLLDSRHGHPLAGEIAATLSSHEPPHPLCRHGYGVDQPKTISLAMYDVDARTLTISDGCPCSSPSLTYRLEKNLQSEPAP